MRTGAGRAPPGPEVAPAGPGEIEALRAENRHLREERERSRLLVAAALDGVPETWTAVFDADLRIVAGGGDAALAGVEVGRQVGHGLEEILAGEGWTRFERAAREALAGASAVLEVRVRGRDVEVRVRPMEDARGAVALGAVTVRPVAEGVAGLDAGSVPFGVVRWDAELRVTSLSRRAEEILGWRTYQVAGLRRGEVPWEVERPRTGPGEPARAAPAGGRSSPVLPRRNLRRDGTEIACEWYEAPRRLADGRLASLTSLVLDVTDRERAREDLRRTGALCRAMARHVPEGAVGVFDEDLRMVLHDGAHPFLADRSATILGLRPVEFAPPHLAPRFEALFREALAGRDGSAELRHRGRIVEARVHPVRDEEGAVIMGMVTTRDVAAERASGPAPTGPPAP